MMVQGVTHGGSLYPIGHGDIAMTNVDCRGYEQELVDCRHSNYYLNRCNHHQDVGVACGRLTPPYATLTVQTETQIRLVGGSSSYGRVEVYTNGAWGTICDKNFDHADVQVVCRSLGYYYGSSYGVAYYGAHFGKGQGNIVIEDLQCQGHERHLSECRSKTWLSNGCDHSRDVGVNCNEYIYEHTTFSSYVGLSNGEYEGSIRLVGGHSYYDGRVEVFYNGQWGTICDNDFDKNEALVICRALGLYPSSYSVAVFGNAYFGQGSGPILIEGLRCSGNEWGLSQCRSRPWLTHSCSHYEDAGVSCDHYETTDTTTSLPLFFRTTSESGYEGQVRLSGGGYYYGRVEVYSRGQWGTICDDSFDHNDVKVICRMLGLYQGVNYGRAYERAYYGSGSGPVIVDDLQCGGYETTIKQCSSTTWYSHNCNHGEDAGLNCYEYYEEATTTFQWWFTTSVPRTKLEDAIFVNCDENGWNIVVDMYRLREIYPNAKASDIYLGENSCNGVQSWNTLTFKQGVRECLTSETIRNNVLVYSNQLIYAERDPNYQFIIRFYNWTVGVECDVQRNETSSGHIHHDSSHLTGPDVTGSSHFSVNMSFYSDPNFMYHLPGNPLQVNVGDKVYVKVFTTTSDWTVKMRVHTCYTKPSQLSPDHLKYFLIQNGCEVDTNTHLISQSAHETRFVFQDFEYTTSHEGIHVFCDAVFCGSSDYSRQCQQSCNPVLRRNIAVERINMVLTTDKTGDANNHITTNEEIDVGATTTEPGSVRNEDSLAETKRIDYEENTSDPNI